MLIDTHAHLDFPEYDLDRDEVINCVKSNGIDYIVNVGSSIQGSKNSLELAAKYSCIYAVVGIHPHDADIAGDNAAGQIKQLAQNDKVKAIGEIGMDYFKNYSKPENQRQLFKSLLTAAKDLNLPVVLHIREAEQDTLKIIKEFLPIRAVVRRNRAGDNRECQDIFFYMKPSCP